MPEPDAATWKQLLTNQFLMSIPVEVSKQLCAVGDFDDLDKLIQRANTEIYLYSNIIIRICVKFPKRKKVANDLRLWRENCSSGTEQQTDAVEVLQQITSLAGGYTDNTTQHRNSHSLASILCFRWGHVQRNFPETMLYAWKTRTYCQWVLLGKWKRGIPVGHRASLSTVSPLCELNVIVDL